MSYPGVTFALELEGADPIVAREIQNLVAQIEGILSLAGIQADGSLQIASAQALDVRELTTNTLTVNGPIRTPGVLTPAILTADQDEYYPNGFDRAYVIRLSASGTRRINGLGSRTFGPNRQPASDRKLLFNVGSDPIVLGHAFAGTIAYLRFALPDSSDWTLGPGEGIEVCRDDVSSVWRPLSGQPPPAVDPDLMIDTLVAATSVETDELIVNGAVELVGQIAPTALVGNEDNYDPGGFDACYYVRLSSTGTHHITGFASHGTGAKRCILNGGANDIILDHDGGGSSASNRMYLPGDESLLLRPGESVEIYKDGFADRWRVTAGSRSGSSETMTLLDANGVSTWALEFSRGRLIDAFFTP